jgi:hypothetical protein
VLISFVIAIVILMCGSVPLVMAHEGVYRLGFWLFTGERLHLSRPGRPTCIAPPDYYLTKHLFLAVTLTYLVMWSLVSVATLAFVPIPVLYWIILTVTLNAAVCVSGLIASIWALMQPRNALFNDRGPATTTYAPAI